MVEHPANAISRFMRQPISHDLDENWTPPSPTAQQYEPLGQQEALEIHQRGQRYRQHPINTPYSPLPYACTQAFMPCDPQSITYKHSAPGQWSTPPPFPRTLYTAVNSQRNPPQFYDDQRNTLATLKERKITSKFHTSNTTAPQIHSATNKNPTSC